jgi:hypothetical protein
MCAPTGRLPVLCHGQLPSLFHSPEHLKASAPSLTSGNGGLPRFLGKNVVGSFEAFVSEPEDIEARLVDPRSELEKIRMSLYFASRRKVEKWFSDTLSFRDPSGHPTLTARAEQSPRVGFALSRSSSIDRPHFSQIPNLPASML